MKLRWNKYTRKYTSPDLWVYGLGALLLLVAWWIIIPAGLVYLIVRFILWIVKISNSGHAKQSTAIPYYNTKQYADWYWNVYYPAIQNQSRFIGAVDVNRGAINININNTTGAEFEHYCAELLRINGYTNVRETKASGDNGVDILAAKDGIKFAVQTKCYSNAVGNDAVQQVNAGKALYKCAVGIVMTNSTFTKSAKDTAEQLGIVLWDRLMLDKMNQTQTTQSPPTQPPKQAPQYGQQQLNSSMAWYGQLPR